MGWLFGASSAEYRCGFLIEAVGLTGRHGRAMLYDAAGSFELKPGERLDERLAALRREAIDAARAELPGASDYRIISESKLREV